MISQVSSGKDADVVIDFGDGSEGINGSLSMEPKYIYWKPGRYDVQVMAKPKTAHDVSRTMRSIHLRR